MRDGIRILLLADSHLGFDLPVRPRSTRRRRGHDFLENYALALDRAFEGDIDLIVHGGDVFDRSRVAPSLAYQALEPLVRAAARGIPVFVVAGNHERSRIPHDRFASHPEIHVFDRPRVVVRAVRGIRVAVAGFPFERKDVRTRFTRLVESTGWQPGGAAVSLLCVHQCVEGATVGPANFTFTRAADVIRGRDIPSGFTAVLSGHIHRHQVLTRDLRGAPLAAPVLYPGSIERTSVAEIGETKGYMIVDAIAGPGGVSVTWTFHKLPARPMFVRELRPASLNSKALDVALRGMIAGVPADAILRIRLLGDVPDRAWRVLTAKHVRTIAPSTMNIEIGPVGAMNHGIRTRRPTAPQPSLELPFPPRTA